MREILFRGKRKDNGEWVVGLVVKDFECYGQKDEHIYIVTHEHPSGCYGGDIYIEVIPETVGQYTGLTDKNGKKIFEGDIVLFPWVEKREVFSVEFVEGEFEAIPKRKSTDIWCIRIGSYAPEFEVIGNIHDNPELLEGGAE